MAEPPGFDAAREALARIDIGALAGTDRVIQAALGQMGPSAWQESIAQYASVNLEGLSGVTRAAQAALDQMGPSLWQEIIAQYAVGDRWQFAALGEAVSNVLNEIDVNSDEMIVAEPDITSTGDVVTDAGTRIDPAIVRHLVVATVFLFVFSILTDVYLRNREILDPFAVIFGASPMFIALATARIAGRIYDRGLPFKDEDWDK